MIAYFKMSEQPVPKQPPVPDVLYNVGEECNYWKKSGEYVQQQAVEDGLLDTQGRLTSTGLQVIVSEQENAQKREELARSLKPRKRRNLRSGIKIWGKMKTSSSPRYGMKTHPSLRTKQGVKSAFIVEVSTLLAKIDGKFVHFVGDGKNCRLVIRVPAEKSGTTSHTLKGSVSDIRRDLDMLIDEIEENIKRK